MNIPKRFTDEVKKINRDLFIIFDEKIKRWKVMHKDNRTGLVRTAMLIESMDGEYEDLNMGHVRWLKEQLLWDLIAKYPDPKDLYHHIIQEHDRAKKAEEVRHRGYVLDFNRTHRKEWKAAMLNAQRGIFHIPEEHKRKIIIT